MNQARTGAALIGKELTDDVRYILELINWKRQYTMRKGLIPKRVYMHIKTARMLYGGLRTPNVTTVIPRGKERVATVCGLEIIECSGLPVGKVDVGCDECE